MKLQLWRNGLDWKREAGKVFKRVESLLPTINTVTAIDALDRVAFNLCYLTDTSNCLMQASWTPAPLKGAALSVFEEASSLMDNLNYDPRWYQMVSECLKRQDLSLETRQVGQLMLREWERHGACLDPVRKQTIQSAWKRIRAQEDVLNNKQLVAKLLGYRSYADWFLADKFITSPDAMIAFLTGYQRKELKADAVGQKGSTWEIMNRIIACWNLRLCWQSDQLYLYQGQMNLGEIIIDEGRSAHCLVLPQRQAYISIPVGASPAKLAHELGHAIHGLLWPPHKPFQLRGTRGTPWDSVEWPSMLMELLYSHAMGQSIDLEAQIQRAIADLQLHWGKEALLIRHSADYGSGYYAYPLGLMVARKMMAEGRVADYLDIMQQGALYNPTAILSSL